RFTTEHTFDKLTFRLTKLKTTRSSPVNTLQELSYTFDPSGNIVQVSDTAQQPVFFNNAVVLPANEYRYDAIYRLKEASGREHSSIGDVQVDHNDVPLQSLPHANSPNSVRNYTETFEYDQVGNILQMFHSAEATPAATWTRNYSYSAGSNRLLSTSAPGGSVSYVHDLHGNMTAMPHLSTITWNAFDQMASSSNGTQTTYYTYGADGQRVRKVYDTNANLIKQRIYLGGYEIYRETVSGSVQLERQTLHVMDGVQRIAMVETKTIAGGVPVGTLVPMYRFQLGNHLGSAMLEVTETGLVISLEEYHPYGTSAYRSSDGSVDVSARRYRYTGKERDEETGLYYNGARYLAAWLGRWTSADPIGMQAGVKLYQYCRGSPVNFTDPSGTDEELTWARPAKPAAHGSSILSAPAAMDTGITPKERDQRIRDAGQRLQGAGDVLSESWEVFRNTFKPMGPEQGKPTIPDAVFANMKQKYNDAGGGRLGVRDAINTLNPLVSLYEETKAGFKAAEQGDQRSVGRHQLGALTSLFSFLGLVESAVGGIPRAGSPATVAGEADGLQPATANGAPVPNGAAAASAPDGTAYRLPSSDAGTWKGTPGNGVFTPSGTKLQIPFRNDRPDFGEFVESGHSFRGVKGLTGDPRRDRRV
ncbi:MAG: RHS repeat-associated core domain-containing protein, partial [Myxococcales bacterium]|nr:RHS repeat-associated core domain-containing protein [Myxococcales bacterium]